jgi:hypothetical protein
LSKWEIALQFQASEIIAPIGSRRPPQHDASGKHLPGCHSREIEGHRSLWLLWRVIGKTESAGHDVCAGKDVPITHEEACANGLSSAGADTHK